MGGNGAAALGAFVELRCSPSVRRLSCAQPHLRGLTFRNSHKGNQESSKREKNNLRIKKSLQDYRGVSNLGVTLVTSVPVQRFRLSLSSALQSGVRDRSSCGC